MDGLVSLLPAEQGLRSPALSPSKALPLAREIPGLMAEPSVMFSQLDAQPRKLSSLHLPPWSLPPPLAAAL
jgi:hypothetical protein